MNAERWQKIKIILEESIELDFVARQAFLEKSCGGDLDLRREIENLLEFENFEDDPLEQAAFSVITENEPPLKNLIGKRIGNYKITEELGAGGMGAVFLVERIDGAFRHKAAVKLIKRGMDTDAILRRFYNERQILATLEHPNVARLIDGGATDDDLPYFVMEYVKGQPLDEYCDKKRLSIPERLEIFRRVCSAVAYAHRQSVIHRDLKPSNILVSEDGTPKLLDFGIAKILRSESADETNEVTETLFRAMTPRYASPEQIKGERLTTASDIYSLGVLLYELLTGRSPYKTAKNNSAITAEMVSREIPERPSAAITRASDAATNGDGKTETEEYISRTRGGIEPEKLRRDLRGNLDDIVLMSLAKNPQDRYELVEDFSDDIQRHLQGLKIRARKTAAQRGTAIFKRQVFANWRTSLAFVLLFLLVAGAASGFSVYFMKKSDESAIETTKFKSIAVLPFKYTGESVSDENPMLGAGLADFLIAKFGQTKKLEVRPMSAVQSYIGGDVRPQPIGQNLGVDTVLSGIIKRENDAVSINAELTSVIDGRTIWKKSYNGNTHELVSLQNKLSEEVMQFFTPQLTDDERKTLTEQRTNNAKAYELYVRGRHFLRNRNPEGYVNAIENFKQAVNLDANYADAYAGLADGYALLSCVVPFNGRHEKMRLAKEYAHRAIELDENLANPHATLGFIGWRYDWKWEESDREFKRAIELNPSYAQAHHWYSYLLVRVNRFDEAVAEIKNALDLDPLSPIIYQDYVEILFYSRRYDETIKAADKALEIAPFSSQYITELKAAANAYKGNHDEFIRIRRQIVETNGNKPEDLVALAAAYFSIDRKKEGQQILDDLRRRGENIDLLVKNDYWISGNMKPILDNLQVEYENRGASITTIHNYPGWDDFRSDPRIREYINRAGTSQYMIKPEKPDQTELQ